MRASILLLFAVLCAGVAHAQPVPGYPRDDGHLLLEFDRYSLKLATRDPTPRIRIYGSGRTLIYRPAYMTRPGLYRIDLPRAEVDALMARVVSDRLHQVDSLAMAETAERAEIERRLHTGQLYYSSDATITDLRVHLPDARLAPLLFENLQETDRRNPGLGTVSGYAELERRLLELADRPGAKRIGEAKALESLD